MTDDVEGVCVVSFSLPADQWIYEPAGDPPAPLPTSLGPDRDRIERAVRAAGKHAVRGVTMSGRLPDFDPDALIMKLVVGLLGYAGLEAQLLSTGEPAPESVALAPHSPESGGGYPDPEKLEMGLEQRDVAAGKGVQP